MSSKKDIDEELEIDDISEKTFMKYESVRESCVTNMYDVKAVMNASGLKNHVIMFIQKNYGKLAQRFLKERRGEIEYD